MKNIFLAMVGWACILIAMLAIGCSAQYFLFRGSVEDWGFLFQWPILWVLYFLIAHALVEMLLARLTREE